MLPLAETLITSKVPRLLVGASLRLLAEHCNASSCSMKTLKYLQQGCTHFVVIYAESALSGVGTLQFVTDSVDDQHSNIRLFFETSVLW